ncbi:MAG: phosphomannomutase [Frankiales bacterium]|nr:phosphomannomutase [Frankiales bacterium]
MADLTQIFKAYDVRGRVPEELDEDIARRVGAAFVEVLRRQGSTVDRIVIGYDMRPSSVPLSRAFAEGATSRGADVIEIGLASTDMLYFASGTLDVPGAMFTASHNPAAYNGIKMCRAGAAPIGQDTGLGDIRDLADGSLPPYSGRTGEISKHEMLDEYADFLISLVPGIKDIHRLTVAVDAGNGMGGLTAPVVLGKLPLDVVPLYFELDGTFPNHEANPIEAANVADLQATVRSSGADVGLAFDGDADRCFVIDETGGIVPPSAITGLVAVRELEREPGATIIYNLITSRAVPEIVTEHGGTALRTRVGHSFIKGTMAETGAIFGGEHSGHFYFRDFWRADSGMLAALHVLAALGGQDKPLSAVLADYTRYSASGEINSTVDDQKGRLQAIKDEYADLELDELDGLTVSSPDGWWFNVRASNTEPLLRLNVEAPDEATMAKVRDEALAVIRGRVIRD